MTYCVGLYLKDGLVLLSDTRTNAGIDNIATYRKMHVFEAPGERAIVALTSGNLAVSQAVINMIREGVENPETKELETIMTVPTMFRAAQMVGETVQRVFKRTGAGMEAQGINFEVSILLGGQIKGRTLRLFQIYAAGNFIQATEDTCFLQTGETKYGKPILVRALSHDSRLKDGVKLALVSMDSTLKSNLSVGMPIDLAIIRQNELKVATRRFEEEDPYFATIRDGWSRALRSAYQAIPDPDWDI
jgi:putative proteasome-type protease